MKYWSIFTPITSSTRPQRRHFTLKNADKPYGVNKVRQIEANGTCVCISLLAWWSSRLFVVVSIQGHELEQSMLSAVLLGVQPPEPTKQGCCCSTSPVVNKLCFNIHHVTVWQPCHCCARVPQTTAWMERWSLFSWTSDWLTTAVRLEINACFFSCYKKIPSGRGERKRFIEPLFNRRLHGNAAVSGKNRRPPRRQSHTSKTLWFLCECVCVSVCDPFIIMNRLCHPFMEISFISLNTKPLANRPSLTHLNATRASAGLHPADEQQWPHRQTEHCLLCTYFHLLPR